MISSGFSWIFKDYHRFARIFTDFHGLSWIGEALGTPCGSPGRPLGGIDFGSLFEKIEKHSYRFLIGWLKGFQKKRSKNDDILVVFRVDFYALIDDVINIRGLWNLLDLHVFSWFSIDFQWIFNGFFDGCFEGFHTCKMVQKGPPWGRPKTHRWKSAR